MSDPQVDVLAIAAHRDDAELTCGGTLVRCVEQGYRTGVIDLTEGEMGTRGSAELRAEEAARAAEVLGLSVRLNAGLPDAGIFNSQENRELLAALLRQLRPRVVILPFYRGRHPDHRMASELGRDAAFLAGLLRYASGEQRPHKPRKVLYALSYREDPVKPTFVVRLEEEQFRRKMEAVRCYGSQFEGADAAGEIFPTGQPLYELLETQARHYGSLIRSPYGEPFYTEETVRVDDIVVMVVESLYWMRAATRPRRRGSAAGHLDEEPLPAGNAVIAHPQGADLRPASVPHPGRQPAADLARKVADHVSCPKVYPDLLAR